MQSIALLIVAAVVAAAMAEGEYYVPRAYYTIDAAGHASAPVPLRRLRRSVGPYPYAYPGHPGANANANANANADARANGWGGASANANANANANARAQGVGGWGVPTGVYGAANPNALRSGEVQRQAGPVIGGRVVSASTSVGLDSTGSGYYDQTAVVS